MEIKIFYNFHTSPLPFMATSPRSSVMYPPRVSSSVCVSLLMWMRRGCPLLSILLAVLTVSPNKQYLQTQILSARRW